MFLSSKQKIQKAKAVDPEIWRALLSTSAGQRVTKRLLDEVRLRGKPVSLPPLEAMSVLDAVIKAMITGDYRALFDARGRPSEEGTAALDWLRRSLTKLVEP